MIKSMQDLTNKLILASSSDKMKLTDKDVEEIFETSIADLTLLTEALELINSWMDIGAAYNLSSLSKAMNNKTTFNLVRNIFVDEIPNYYVYAFEPTTTIPKQGSTLLRKRRIKILNFGGSKTTSPKLKIYRERKVQTALKPTKDIISKTFFINNYNDAFIALAGGTAKLKNSGRHNKALKSLNTVVRHTVFTCLSYQFEHEVLVNTTEVKCKVITVLQDKKAKK